MSWPQSSFLKGKFVYLCVHATGRPGCLTKIPIQYFLNWSPAPHHISSLCCPSKCLSFTDNQIIFEFPRLKSSWFFSLLNHTLNPLVKTVVFTYGSIHHLHIFNTCPDTVWLKPPSYFTWIVNLPPYFLLLPYSSPVLTAKASLKRKSRFCDFPAQNLLIFPCSFRE